jgi:hypothetical protein
MAAILPYITPDLFSGLGRFSGLAYGLTLVLVPVLVGFFTKDPLRVPDNTKTGTLAAPQVPAALSPETTPVTPTDPATVTVTPEYTATPTG